MDYSYFKEFVEKTLSLIKKGDLVCDYSVTTTLECDMDLFKSVEDKRTVGVGLRVFENVNNEIKCGNSFSNELNPENLVKMAKESSLLGETIDIDLPEMIADRKNEIIDKKYEEYTKENMSEIAKNILKGLKTISKKAKANCMISKSRSYRNIANTSGFSGEKIYTYYNISCGLVLVEENGGLLFVSDSSSSNYSKIDYEKLLENIEWKYKNSLKTVSIDTGYYPVIFTPDALDIIIHPIVLAANGKMLYKNLSYLKDKIDEKIAVEKFSLIDDPLYSEADFRENFDDEGVLCDKINIIENGVFKNFIYDLTIAKKLNKKSNGRANRSVSSLPSPSTTNLIIKKGEVSLEEMIKSIKKGVLVDSFLGGGMNNELSGDFSVNIELGYLIEDGEIKGRIKDTMIAGNVYDIINKIDGIENKIHKKGNDFFPHILFKEVSIAK